jgi:hypothetical protein
MDDQQHDALLEELRKLRSEVRALKIIGLSGAGLLLTVGLAVGIEFSWFNERTLRVLWTILIILGVCLAIWLLRFAIWLLWVSVFGTHFYRGAREALAKNRVVPERNNSSAA